MRDALCASDQRLRVYGDAMALLRGTRRAARLRRYARGGALRSALLRALRAALVDITMPCLRRLFSALRHFAATPLILTRVRDARRAAMPDAQVRAAPKIWHARAAQTRAMRDTRYAAALRYDIYAIIDESYADALMFTPPHYALLPRHR